MAMPEKTLNNYGVYLRALAGDSWDDFTFVDYWTLRKRSLRLFRENIYAKGIIRRLIWNEIHTGLVASPVPESSIIWPKEDPTAREEKGVRFGEEISTQFNLYANTPTVFDWGKHRNFGEFQAQVRFESLVCGDGIIISRIDKDTQLPRWQWVNGDNIRTPDNYSCPPGGYIKHGVEFDKNGKKIAFHVRSEVNGTVTYERVPVRGKHSGRLISWMVYGSETLLDDTRGEPFLADTLYMLKDLDRYRDAETRAAVVNAMLAYFIERGGNNTTFTRPTDGLASRLRPNNTEPKGYMEEGPRQEIKITEPGTIYDNLLPGDHIQSFQKKNADDFCQQIYEQFVTQAVLTGQLNLPGFIGAYNDVSKWRMISAWLSCAWIGLNRPAVDRQKEVSASQTALDNGLSTFDIEARRTCGLSFAQVMQTQKRERELMERMGFTPHVDEDNNGKPAYSSGNKDDGGEDGDDGNNGAI